MLNAIILGLVQGLTEFLPVSSSGHLKIFGALLHREMEGSTTFDVMLHVGTLVAVLIVYRKDVWELIKNFFGAIADVCRGRGLRLKEMPYRRLILWLIVGSIPAMIGGLFLDHYMERIPVWAVGICLFVTAALLFWSDRMKEGVKKAEDMTWKDALITGVFQMVALLPGISRSGSTIVGATSRKLKREDAVRFSFLLSLIVIGGAAVLKVPDVMESTTSMQELLPYAVGMIVSAISGFFAIRFLIAMTKKAKLSVFGWYCILMGLFALIFGIVTHV